VSISGISGQSTSNESATTTSRTSSLGQDAFLRLLTTQLQNQDPLKPQENGEFIAQLATFSSLEKLTSIELSMKQLAAAVLGTPAGSDPGAGTDTGAGDTSGTGTDTGTNNGTSN
jgi:flagellar basal-body rod modification protein FlgD